MRFLGRVLAYSLAAAMLVTLPVFMLLTFSTDTANATPSTKTESACSSDGRLDSLMSSGQLWNFIGNLLPVEFKWFM